MDEVELPEHARDTRTGLRRLAPEIEAARDKIIDHFEDKPFAELKEFVQKLLENEEDEAKRIGALAARVYLLRKRIMDFEETVEFVPATEPSANWMWRMMKLAAEAGLACGCWKIAKSTACGFPKALLLMFRRPMPNA